MPQLNGIDSYTFTYRETWGRYDICWEITKDSRGNMLIAHTGYSPFSGYTTERVELMRFVNGWAYLNVKQALTYFGEDPDKMGITKDGWLRLQQPAEFYTSVLDMKNLFLLYAEVLSQEFGGMDFTNRDDTFSVNITSLRMFGILKDTEQKMDAEWVPPIRNMIKGIKWKDYEKKLFADNEKDVLRALTQAGIAEWQGKLLLSGVKTMKQSVILYVYENYLGNVKSEEDEQMRVTSSGLQLFIGSAGTGTVVIDTSDGCVIDYLMKSDSGDTAERKLTFQQFDGVVENPKSLVDIGVFGPLLKEILSSLL